MSTNEFVCLNPFRPNGKYSIKRIPPKKYIVEFLQISSKNAMVGLAFSFALAHILPIQYE